MKYLTIILVLFAVCSGVWAGDDDELSRTTVSLVKRNDADKVRAKKILVDAKERLTKEIDRLKERNRDSEADDIVTLEKEVENINVVLASFNPDAGGGDILGNLTKAQGVLLTKAIQAAKVDLKTYQTISGVEVTYTHKNARMDTGIKIDPGKTYLVVPHPEDVYTKGGYDRTKNDADQEWVTVYEGNQNLWVVVKPEGEKDNYMVGITKITEDPVVESEKGGTLVIRRHGGSDRWRGSIRVKVVEIPK